MGKPDRERDLARNARTVELLVDIKNNFESVHLDTNRPLGPVSDEHVSRKDAMRKHKLTETVRSCIYIHF